MNDYASEECFSNMATNCEGHGKAKNQPIEHELIAPPEQLEPRIGDVW